MLATALALLLPLPLLLLLLLLLLLEDLSSSSASCSSPCGVSSAQAQNRSFCNTQRTYGTRKTQDVHPEAAVEVDYRNAQNVDNAQNDPRSAFGGNDTARPKRGKHSTGHHDPRGTLATH